MSDYYKLHGVYKTPKKITAKYKTRCKVCLEIVYFHSLTGKYCEKCKPLGTDYIRKIKLGFKYKNIEEYLQFIIDSNRKHKERAKYILNNRKNYKPKFTKTNTKYLF